MIFLSARFLTSAVDAGQLSVWCSSFYCWGKIRVPTDRTVRASDVSVAFEEINDPPVKEYPYRLLGRLSYLERASLMSEFMPDNPDTIRVEQLRSG